MSMFSFVYWTKEKMFHVSSVNCLFILFAMGIGLFIMLICRSTLSMLHVNYVKVVCILNGFFLSKWAYLKNFFYNICWYAQINF